MSSLPRSHQLLAALTIYLACASLAPAFEQSSYFVFDIVDSPESKPIEGRLAVPSAALAAVKTEAKTSKQIKAERGEFEIDFNQPIQVSGNEGATFSFDQPIKAPTEVDKSSFGSDSFDLGTSSSIFGE